MASTSQFLLRYSGLTFEIVAHYHGGPGKVQLDNIDVLGCVSEAIQVPHDEGGDDEPVRFGLPEIYQRMGLERHLLAMRHEIILRECQEHAAREYKEQLAEKNRIDALNNYELSLLERMLANETPTHCGFLPVEEVDEELAGRMIWNDFISRETDMTWQRPGTIGWSITGKGKAAVAATRFNEACAASREKAGVA